MPRHALTFMPDLHIRRVHLRLHSRSSPNWRRVEVRQYIDAAAAVDHWKRHPRQVEPLRRQWQQMLPLDRHRRPDRLAPACDHSLLFFFTACLQHLVQMFQVPRHRQGHQVVPPEIPTFSFDTSLFIPTSWVAKLALKSPMRPESDELVDLLPLVSPQDFVYGASQVVESKQRKNPAEMSERQFVRFQKRLLAGVRIRPVE